MSAATCPTVWTGWRAWRCWKAEGKPEYGLRPGGGDASRMAVSGANLRARDPERPQVRVAVPRHRARQSGQSVDGVSDHHPLQLRSDLPEIVSVAGYHGLPGPLRTNGDVGIDDVGRPGSCQQSAYSRRVRSVQRNKVRTSLSN